MAGSGWEGCGNLLRLETFGVWLEVYIEGAISGGVIGIRASLGIGENGKTGGRNEVRTLNNPNP